MLNAKNLVEFVLEVEVALYVLNIEIIYFESFGFEHIPKNI